MHFWITNVVLTTLILNSLLLTQADVEVVGPDEYALADKRCKAEGNMRSTIEPPYICVCEYNYERQESSGICVKKKSMPNQKELEDLDGKQLENIAQAVYPHHKQRNPDPKFEFEKIVPNEQNQPIELAVKNGDISDSSAQQSPVLDGRSADEATEGYDPPLAPEALQAGAVHKKEEDSEYFERNTIMLWAVVAACSIAGVIGLVVAGVCWYRLQRSVKAQAEAEYPAYGVTGPQSRDKLGSPGDRKLAQSAQMYHYQHQKQQMLAMEKADRDMNGQGSDLDSEEENEEGDYTVYECPGLAPTGEMEVKNPLFSEDTPTVTPGVTPGNGHTEHLQ